MSALAISACVWSSWRTNSPLTVRTTLLGLILAALCSCDAPPQGEGSYARGDEIFSALGELDPTAQLPTGHYRTSLPDGSWFIVTGDNSHSASYSSGNGGTIGILTSTGERYIFFGHVCGPGPEPLRFPADSQAELIAYLQNEFTEYLSDTRTRIPFETER